MLAAEIIRPDALTPRQVRTWTALCGATPSLDSPLLRPEFAQAVGRARADAHVAVFTRGGRTIGFLAHHRRPDGYARPIGAPFSDYHALVTEPDAGLALPEALALARLKALRLSGLIDPSGAVTTAVGVSEGFAIDLAGAGPEAYLAALQAENPKRFKNWRRLGNKMERECGRIELTAPERSPEVLEQLFCWKSQQLRRSGLHDVLRPPWVRRLMADLFATTDTSFGGLLITLRADGVPVAAHFGVRAGEVFHPWITAYDPARAGCAPGITLLNHVIPAMPRLGLEVYDFGTGHDHYKRPFASRTRLVREGVVRAQGARPALAPLEAVFGERAGGLARRAWSRLDHIAAAEPTELGRLRGVWDAFASGRRRLAPCPPAEGLAEA